MRGLSLALALCLPGAAHAAGLPELLAAAEEQNVDRRISLEQRRRASEELAQAWSGLLPFLTVQGSWTRNQRPVEVGPFAPGGEPVVITPEDQLDAVGRLELPLVDAARWVRIDATSSADAAAGFRDEVTRDAVRRQVASTYYGFAAALSVREAAQRTLAVAEAQQRLQEIRRGAGAATELEVLRATAEVERSRQTVAETFALVATSRRALLTLSGVDPGEEARLPPDDLTPDSTLEELEGKAPALPAVQAARLEAEAAGTLANAARLALLPSVSAHFTERLTNATGFSGDNDSYTTGLLLTWRLDAPTYYAGSAQRALSGAAGFVAEKQRLAARDQVFSDWQRLTTAIQKVTAAGAQVEAARRAAQVTRDRYDAGAATQTDVIQGERELFGAEVNQIQARTELASSHVALRISAGLPLRVE